MNEGFIFLFNLDLKTQKIGKWSLVSVFKIPLYTGQFTKFVNILSMIEFVTLLKWVGLLMEEIKFNEFIVSIKYLVLLCDL